MIDHRLKLAKSALNGAKKYIKRGDPVQSSEKIYKTVEECVKILAEKNRLPEYDKAEKEGRWWAHLLGSASHDLAKKLKENKIGETWGVTYDLHVWGFHEGKYGIKEVKQVLPYAEWILDYTKNSK